ncbi:FAD-binding oxidoreductase [Ramlibacter terrae]|uniref:FAD-binding oxidoreductase n=1 Tax=Ramlibacter terrae TaxID=2732511 RepID=A0ABX6P4G8_9BURK|nr:FAD-binding oxidoreductase [Ramlibacter terrae]
MQPNSTAVEADFVIIGGGIAAASVGHWLAPHGRVVLLERESQPGYHSTGRSAALFMESYGTPQVRALTLASRAFFDAPPAGFAEHPVLSPRGALIVAEAGQEAELEEWWHTLRSVTPRAQRLDAAGACALVPVLREERIVGAVYEPDAADMDVHAIHRGYLRGLRRAGGAVVCDAEVTALRREGDQWQVQAGGQTYQAPVVLNAAGAGPTWWARWPACRAGPAAETPRRLHLRAAGRRRHPCMAHGGQRRRRLVLQARRRHAARLAGQRRPGRSARRAARRTRHRDGHPPHRGDDDAHDPPSHAHWAGLRSFVPDGDLVGGFDPAAPGFFWVAAQGGYGIQTSPAMGEACAALARGLPIPERIAGFGLTEAMLSPARLRAASTVPA